MWKKILWVVDGMQWFELSLIAFCTIAIIVFTVLSIREWYEIKKLQKNSDQLFKSYKNENRSI